MAKAASIALAMEVPRVHEAMIVFYVNEILGNANFTYKAPR
jgi:hypothetical protein